MSESILANISNNVRLFTNIIINPYIRDSKSTTNIYGYRELDRLYEITLSKTKLLINKTFLGAETSKEIDDVVSLMGRISTYKFYDIFDYIMENNKLISRELELERHSLNVALLVMYSANPLKIRVTRELVIAALLHDIGKYSIDAEILFKSSKLTDDEFKKIKMHTVIGHKKLETLNYSNLIAYTARNHHENYKSGGYPDRTNIANMDVVIQLVRLCDMFEAMTSERVYKDPMSPIESLKIISSDINLNNSMCVQKQWVDFISKKLHDTKIY